MTVHVAILLRPYLRLILDGRKTVESRLTRQPIVPYKKIVPGDRIYFKASAGPYMATAVAESVEFFDNLTPAKVHALRQRFNREVCGDAAFWQWKRASRYATFIRLREVQPTSQGPAIAPSPGPAWFVLNEKGPGATNDLTATGSPASADTKALVPYRLPQAHFDVPLTAGALRNNYVRVPRSCGCFPADAYVANSRQAGKPITLQLSGGQTVQTDVLARGMVRWRGWGEHFTAAKLRAGDEVRFTPAGGRTYRVEFVRRDQASQTDRAASATAGESRGSSRPCPRAADSSLAGSGSPPPSPPQLEDFIAAARLQALIAEARDEDLGPEHRDITGDLFIRAAQRATLVLRSRAAGRLCGAALLSAIAAIYDPRIRVELLLSDGAVLQPGSVIARFRGPLRSLLAMERVALNFATHLSGIATLTARYVAAVTQVPGNRARICATRKTIPGLRGLEKYAVVCGGGVSHRMGLYDAVLVKDNHIAHLTLAELASILGRAIMRARAATPKPAFIEVEVDTLAQMQRLLAAAPPARPDMILLDNMTPAQLRQAVALRDKLAPQVLLEASGGINLDTVGAIAAAGAPGLDRISVGAITHSAPALDLGLDDR